MFRHCYLWFISCVLTSCARPAYQEQGWASYIADHYSGRITSSGQPYHPQSYTAAHTSLPLGTEVSVKNLYTARSVTVVVTDRFPYYPGRVINLSRAAAQYIGMPNMQLAQVELKAYKLPHGGKAYPPKQKYYPQQQQQYYQPQPQPQAPRTAAPGAPNAPAFNGSNGPPQGLSVF
jgi:rare lipoprotein A